MKKKVFIICESVVVLAIIVTATILVINWPKKLFNINPNEVASISGGTGTINNITDTSEINQFVKGINDFRYIRKKSLLASYGWLYSIELYDSSGNSLLKFVLINSTLINYGNNSYEIPANSTTSYDYFSNQ